jgi:hypothetical protein
MYITALLTSVLLASGLAGRASALRTVASSHCASVCGNTTETTTDDIVCTDADFGTPKGQIFAECLTCQLNSTAIDPGNGDTDLKWLLCMPHPPTPLGER